MNINKTVVFTQKFSNNREPSKFNIRTRIKLNKKMLLKLFIFFNHFNDIESIVGGWEAEAHRNDSTAQ